MGCFRLHLLLPQPTYVFSFRFWQDLCLASWLLCSRPSCLLSWVTVNPSFFPTAALTALAVTGMNLSNVCVFTQLKRRYWLVTLISWLPLPECRHVGTNTGCGGSVAKGNFDLAVAAWAICWLAFVSQIVLLVGIVNMYAALCRTKLINSDCLAWTYICSSAPQRERKRKKLHTLLMQQNVAYL